MDLIVVGAGAAFQEHYAGVLENIAGVKVIGIVDRADDAQLPAWCKDAWRVAEISQIPNGVNRDDTAVVILTPDHYPVIKELAEMGFKFMLVEKPLVSRDWEVKAVKGLRDEKNLRLYAIDFYIPKLFPLQVAFGVIGKNDPRRKYVQVTGWSDDAREALGKIEGIAVQVIEAGNFCLPDLAKRPWLEKDPEIGGMLRDLGTHALAPLVAAGLLDERAAIHDVMLSQLHRDRSTLVPLRRSAGNYVELYASALLTANHGIPVQVSFGKVPFNGGIWALTIRGERGMFYAGLRTGQPAVLVPNKGEPVVFSLTQSTYQIVLEEALMYFNGELPGFDGNTNAFFTSMGILQRMRKHYFGA